MRIHTTVRLFLPGYLTYHAGMVVTAASRTILDAAEAGTAPDQIDLAVARRHHRHGPLARTRGVLAVRVSYDPEVNALYIQLRVGTPVDRVDVTEGVTADLDEHGQVIGIEVLDATERLGDDGLTNIALERFPLEGSPIKRAG